jgi:hypothetical protein
MRNAPTGPTRVRYARVAVDIDAEHDVAVLKIVAIRAASILG